MQTVNLIGTLGERFGHTWKTNCVNMRDIFKLIDCQTPGFRQYLIHCAENGINFEVRRGEEFLTEPEDLLLSIGPDDIYIAEIPAGSKGGVGKILAAVAIVAITIGTGGFGAGASGFAALTANTASIIATSLAVNLAITGITELLISGPEAGEASSDSYLFNGPVNTTKQGIPVPVCYGELVVGGAAISTSFQPQPFGTGNFNYQTPYITYYGPAIGGVAGVYANDIYAVLPQIGNIYTSPKQEVDRELENI